MRELVESTEELKKGYIFYSDYFAEAHYLKKNVTFFSGKRYENKVNTFRKFYTDNKEQLFGYLLRKSGNYHLAADIMQESFTRYLEQYSDREQSPALLFTISRNLLYDHVRTKRFDTSYEDNRHSLDIDQEDAYSIKEEYKRVFKAMQELNDEEQDILSLVVSSGLTYREIADMTGNSEANIKVKIHRSRLKLKKILRRNTP